MGQKKGGRQGALCSAGHPNLQGRSIRFQHPRMGVKVQRKIQINGSVLWNFKFNWGQFIEVNSLVAQIHRCQFSIAQHKFLFRTKRVFVCPGKLNTEKQLLCQSRLVRNYAEETTPYRKNAKNKWIRWVISPSEITKFGSNHPSDNGIQ